MYAWRSTSDKNNSGSSGRAFVFNPITGARCAQRVLYNPQPTQRDLDVVRGGRGRDTKHSAAGDDDGDSWSSEGEEEEEENEGGTIWDSAVGPGGDRRRHWQQTNFNFSPHHFHKQRRVGSTNAASTPATSHGAAVYVPYIHDTILLCSPSRCRQQAADVTQDREAVQRRRRSSTRVVLAVTCNAAEARAREVQAATEAKNGELLSMSTFSPGPRVARRKSYNGASSPTHCFKEADASSVAAGATTAAAAAVGAVRSSLTGAPPAATTDGVARPVVESLGEELSTPGDTRLGQSGGVAPLRRSYGKSAGAAAAAAAAAGAAPANTTAADAGVSSSAIVGSTLASRQRVLSMAEGVYRDLVMGEAQRTGTVFGSATSLRMASVPTCELAYTLRASYMQGSHGRSSGGIGDKAGATASRNELPRSATYDTTASLPSRMAVSTGGSSSVLGRSAPSGTSQRPHPPRRQHSGNPPRPRPASANTAMSSSGVQGSSVYDPAPHRRTVTAVGINGHVGSSFFEEVGDEDEEVDAESAATEARLQEIPAVAVSAGGDAAQTAQGDAAPKRTSLPNPTPPPPLPTLAVKRIPSDRSLTSSSDVVSRTMSAASPLGGGDGATTAGSAHLTAPPTLSRFALEHALLHNEGGAALRSTRRSSPLRTRRRRSSRFTVSPTSDTYCEPPPHPTPPQQQQQQHTHVADSITAGTHAVAEGSQSTNNDGAHRGNCPGSKHSHRPRRRPHTSQQRTGSRRAGSSQHRRGQSTRSAHETQHSDGGNETSATARLPSDAKETRVYAVRMRTTFTNADASVTQRQWRDPPRRGVPVLLPEDWQIST